MGEVRVEGGVYFVVFVTNKEEGGDENNRGIANNGEKQTEEDKKVTGKIPVKIHLIFLCIPHHLFIKPIDQTYHPLCYLSFHIPFSYSKKKKQKNVG